MTLKFIIVKVYYFYLTNLTHLVISIDLLIIYMIFTKKF